MQSNETTIADMNEVIASFMGASSNGRWMMIPHRKFSLSSRYYPSQLKYHNSYDWLMPVWKKFLDLTFDDEIHELKHAEIKSKLAYSFLYADIRIAHSDMHRAIQWYNNLTTNNG